MKKISRFFPIFTAFYIFSAVCFYSQSEPKKEISALETGQTIEREIGGIYTRDSFYVNLLAGQFLRVEAEQFECDVIFALISEDKLNVFDVNNASPDKFEFSSAAVEKSGRYELQLMSVSEKKGKYKLKIAELREATAKELHLTAGIILSNDAFNNSSSSSTTDEIRQSLTKFENALEKYRLAEEKSYEARANNDIASMFMRLGNAKKAIEYFEKSGKIAESIQDKFEIVTYTSNLGAAYQTIGEWQKAFDFFSKSLNISREIKNVRKEIIGLLRIGNFFLVSGEPARALDYFTQALALSRSEKLSENYESDALESIGKTNLTRNEYQNALESFQKALELSRYTKSKRREAATLNNLGKTNFLLGNIMNSVENLTESLKISRDLKDKSGESATLRILGQIYLANNETDRAHEVFTQALEISRFLENTQTLAETLLFCAKTDVQKKNFDAAQVKIEEAVKLIEKVRSKVQTANLRDAFSANLQSFYAFYIELLMRRDELEPNKRFAELAFEANERARARGLLNLLHESNINIRAGVDAKLLEKEREIQNLLSARLENLTKVLGGKSKPEKIQNLRTEVEKFRSEHEQIQSLIRQTSPHYSALTQPNSLTLEEIRRDILDENSLLLQYHLGENRSYLWIVSKVKFQTIALPAKAEIEISARTFTESLTERNKRVKFETADEQRVRIERADEKILDNSENLSRLIIEPAKKHLANKRLLIAADGILQYVPFSALQTVQAEPKFLIETNEIVSLPSASVLAILRRETSARKPSPKTLAILADPVFDADDERYKIIAEKNKSEKIFNQVSFEKPKKPAKSLRDFGFEDGFNLSRLPFTRREADVISGFVPNSQQEKLLDFNANRSTAVSPELANYRYLHFATHSFVNDKMPELSGIVLSLYDENGKEQDGILRTDDIFNLKFPAELVVLSGCQTGLGKEIKGEGLIGLTRGFMYAGAKRVAVSLWDVNDEATSDLMASFYGEMFGRKKSSPSAALRSAQIKLINGKRWQNPYYWSAFILQGEPK